MTRQRRPRKPSPAVAESQGAVERISRGRSERVSEPAATPSWPWERAAWLMLALIPLLWGAFAPILGNGYVGWDDPANFLENPSFQGLGWDHVRWAWTTYHLGVYQPVSWMLFELEHAVSGLDPRGFHLTSLVIQILNALVLVLLVVELLRRTRPELAADHPRAFWAGVVLAGALYMAHPLRVEVVAWISCQPYLPCALFLMLTVLAYLRAHPATGETHAGWLVASLLAYALALNCKAVAVPLPLVLLILDVYPLHRLAFRRGGLFGHTSWPCWLEKIPYALLSAIYAALAVRARQVSQPVPLAEVSLLAMFPARFSHASYGIWFYLVKTLWPAELTAYYPLPAAGHWDEPQFVLSRLLLITTTVVLVLVRRRAVGLLAAWLAYLVMLAPNSGLLRIGDQIACDRYSYIALLPFVPLLALGLVLLLARLSVRPAVAVLVLLGAVLGLEIALTRTQCTIWHDSIGLWTHVYEHGASRENSVLNNLGYSLTMEGRAEEALPYLRECTEREPRNFSFHHSLGSALMALGRDDEAREQFQQALRINPLHEASRRDMEHLEARRKRESAIAPPGA